MDPQQQQHNPTTTTTTTILQAIAVSSLHIPGADRPTAFAVLQYLKTYAHRVALCLEWLHTETPIVVTVLANGSFLDHGNHTQQQQQQHHQQQYDISMATKLLALEILDQFLVTGYAQCTEEERLALRQAVLQASHMLTTNHSNSNDNNNDNSNDNSNSNDNNNRARTITTTTTTTEARILARKLAKLLEGLVLRDFPQRWPTLAQDLFEPVGGLWSDHQSTNSNSNNNNSNNSTIGVKICLECFTLLAEDCTDSDFNVKISTQRRLDRTLRNCAHRVFATVLSIARATLSDTAAIEAIAAPDAPILALRTAHHDPNDRRRSRGLPSPTESSR